MFTRDLSEFPFRFQPSAFSLFQFEWLVSFTWPVFREVARNVCQAVGASGARVSSATRQLARQVTYRVPSAAIPEIGSHWGCKSNCHLSAPSASNASKAVRPTA